MKNRVLLTMLIIFIILAGICIACGTIFIVRDVEIVAANETTNLTDVEENKIMTAVNLRGKNILFNLKKNRLANAIKSVSPMLKLQTVQAQFPNKVVLHVVRRVPVYFDQKFYYDADMCIVERTTGNCVNISGANLDLNDELQIGDLAVSDDPVANYKIHQLQVIAGYYQQSLAGFQITYEDSDAVNGADYLCLRLQIKNNVTFRIKTLLSDDFVTILEYTDAAYRKPPQPQTGIYEARYDDNGKVVVLINGVKYREQ